MAEKLPMAKRITTSKTINGAVLGFEKTLFKAADKLRGHMDAAEYLYTLHIKPISRLRDALLPKLMKGEIKVKDTELLVKEKIK